MRLELTAVNDSDEYFIRSSSSYELLLSARIEGEGDDKVAIEIAKINGMSDFLVVSVSHKGA